MKIIFLSNFFNYHQKALSDALFCQTGGNYIFVATEEMSADRKQMGWKQEDMPSYVFDYAGADEKSRLIMLGEIDKADVVVLGSAPTDMVIRRLKRGKLVYYYSERPMKNPFPFLFRCRYGFDSWKAVGRYRNAYLLAASAYAYPDYSSMLCFRSRGYKWGYFPEAKRYDVAEMISAREQKNTEKQIEVNILWVGRMIGWKHPEAAVEVAERLSCASVKFELNMIGAGPLESAISDTVEQKGLLERVHCIGAKNHEEVRRYMERADILLFTSDRNEGWGVVLNEAMNSACAVVASGEIGSVPFLIQNNHNGLIFKDQDWGDLYNKVRWLTEHKKERGDIQKNAYRTITEVWNADSAAKSLLELSEELLNGKKPSREEGPCSRAEKYIKLD